LKDTFLTINFFVHKKLLNKIELKITSIIIINNLTNHTRSCSKVLLVTRIFSWCEIEHPKPCKDFVTFYKFLTGAEVFREGSNPRGVGEVWRGGKRSFSWMRYERLSQKFSQPGTKARCKSSSRTTPSHSFASVSLARRRKLLVERLPPSNSFRYIYALLNLR